QQLLPGLRCYLRLRRRRLDPDPLVVARLRHAQLRVAGAVLAARRLLLDVTPVSRMLQVDHDPRLILPAVRFPCRLKRLRPFPLRGIIPRGAEAAGDALKHQPALLKGRREDDPLVVLAGHILPPGQSCRAFNPGGRSPGTPSTGQSHQTWHTTTPS